VHITAAFIDSTPPPTVAALVRLLERTHSELVSEYWQHEHDDDTKKAVGNSIQQPHYEDYQNFLDSAMTAAAWSRSYFPVEGTFARLMSAQRVYNPHLAIRGSSLHTIPVASEGGCVQGSVEQLLEDALNALGGNSMAAESAADAAGASSSSHRGRAYAALACVSIMSMAVGVAVAVGIQRYFLVQQPQQHASAEETGSLLAAGAHAGRDEC
jgi:hypothetical protein